MRDGAPGPGLVVGARPRRFVWRALALAVLVAAIWFLNRTMGPGGWALVGARLTRARPWPLALRGGPLAVSALTFEDMISAFKKSATRAKTAQP